MVRMDGEKMSKSLGNMVFVRDLLRSYSPDAIRLCLLGHHYREVWEWAPWELEAAAGQADRLAEAASSSETVSSSARAEFIAALEDDLNTPRAISVLEGTRGPELRDLAAVLGLTLG
jgi:L-cysteine:1D-myo-inositol 2-amino-2-deoxy-alpha-D-glucopyranoside ligase